MTTVVDALATWAGKISAAWRNGPETILKCGCLLIAASDSLDHGEFTKMIEHDLPFGPRTAQRLMAIARDKRLSNPTHVSLLPPSWGTLYELTRLTDAEFEKAVSDGIINSEMRRRDVEAIINARPLPFPVRQKTAAAVPQATSQSSQVVPFGRRASTTGEAAVAEDHAVMQVELPEPACPEQGPDDDDDDGEEELSAFNLVFTLVRATPAICRLAVQMLFDPEERRPEWDDRAFARAVHELNVAVASNPTLRSISDLVREEDASKDRRKEGVP